MTLKELYDLGYGKSVRLDLGTFAIVIRRRDDWHGQLEGGTWSANGDLNLLVGYLALAAQGLTITAVNEDAESEDAS